MAEDSRKTASGDEVSRPRNNMPVMQLPSTGWGHDCDSSVKENLDIPKGFRLWRVSDGASEVPEQKFSTIIYSVQHNASKDNLQDPLWLPPPGFYLDLWGIYLAAKLSPSKRKRFNLWPQLFTTQGDLLRDFPRFGTAPQMSFWHLDNGKWVPDTRKIGNGMYLVWRDATVLASPEVQRDLDKLNIYRTRTAVVNDAKRRNASEFTFGQFSASKVELGDFDRDDRIVVATTRLQDWQYDQWQFITTSAVGQHHWTKVVLNKDYDRRNPYLSYDTYVGNDSEDLLELWAPGQGIGRRQQQAAKQIKAIAAQSANEKPMKTQKRRTPREQDYLRSRPSKRHRVDDGSEASNPSLSHAGRSSGIDGDDDEWAVRQTDEGDNYNMQQDDDPNAWALDEINHDQEGSSLQDASNDWVVQEDDEDDEEPEDRGYDD